MLFPTMTFALFFVVVLGVSWRLNDRPLQWRLFVLASSYVFYGWWDPVFCLLLAGSTVGNHLFVHAIHRSRSDRGARTWMALGVAANVILLGFFKYYGFFVDSLLAALEPFGMAPTAILVKVVLPIGISFFTFCAISYLVDVYRQEQEPIPLLDFAVYLSFFPHLVAGPIVRVSEFAPQLRRLRNPDAIDTTRAARLICRGLFKKVVIANYLGTAIVDPVFLAPGQSTNWELAVGAVAYAVQIYADFSGYTDIAIGIALMMGIKFPDNFDQPYSATSIQEFWRRWHMTLSRWLRDYVYIPLGGNRGGERAEMRNLVATMAIGGLWHGANWTFVIWGFYHGFGLAAERWWKERPPSPRRRLIDLRRPVDDPGDGPEPGPGRAGTGSPRPRPGRANRGDDRGPGPAGDAGRAEPVAGPAAGLHLRHGGVGVLPGRRPPDGAVLPDGPAHQLGRRDAGDPHGPPGHRRGHGGPVRAPSRGGRRRVPGLVPAPCRHRPGCGPVARRHQPARPPGGRAVHLLPVLTPWTPDPAPRRPVPHPGRPRRAAASATP